MTESGGSNRLRATPRETVELTESEHIVPRGSARVRWFVRLRDGWTPAASFGGARVEPLTPAPGVVWTRRIELDLPRGTRLMRLSTTPRPVQRSPLAYLQASLSAPRRVLRTFHRVGPRGVVHAESGPKAPRAPR